MAGLRKNGAFAVIFLAPLFTILPATRALYVNIPAPAPGTGPDMSPGQMVYVTFDWEDGDAYTVDIQVFHSNNQYAATMMKAIQPGIEKVTTKFPSVSQDAGQVFYLQAVRPGVPGTDSRSGNFVIVFKDLTSPAPTTTPSQSTTVAPPTTASNTPTQSNAPTTSSSSSSESATTQTSSGDPKSSSVNSGTSTSIGDTQGTRTYVSNPPNPTPGGGTPDSPSGSDSEASNGEKKKQTPFGPIVGGVVGGVVLLAIIRLLWLRLRRRKDAGSPSLQPFAPSVGEEMREQPPDNSDYPDYGRMQMARFPSESHSLRPSIGNDNAPDEPPESEEITIQRQIHKLSLRMMQLRGSEQDPSDSYDPPPDYRSQRMSVL